MAAKTSEWRPGPTVCRCCLSEGCYKDISTEYFWMGKKEIYSEMLAETFDLSIAYSKSGGPNSNSRLICEPCISRLRDAADFKRQVAECEKTFLQHLDPSSSDVTSFDVAGNEANDAQREVKVEQVKIEKLGSDEEFDAAIGFDDDDDDLDDEPLTKLASRLPKKELMDAADLDDNATAALTTKRKSSKTKTQVKKVRNKKESKASASKTKPEKKKKAECDPARLNAEAIVKYTTATPFRVNVKSIMCVYCGDLFEDPSQFRAHNGREHATFKANMAFAKLPKSEYIKVDTIEIDCRLCAQRHANLESIAAHLKESHAKELRLDSPLGVMPYLLDSDWVCVVCGKGMPSLLHLNKHTVSHFLSFVCEICGKSYAASSGLLTHVRSKHEREYRAYCKRCRVIFPSMREKVLHQRTSKRCMTHCCTQCPERFPSYKSKQRHMMESHGVVANEYSCSRCQLGFGQRQAFYEHYRLCHSADCVVCTHCGRRFACASKLNRHLKKHA